MIDEMRSEIKGERAINGPGPARYGGISGAGRNYQSEVNVRGRVAGGPPTRPIDNDRGGGYGVQDEDFWYGAQNRDNQGKLMNSILFIF